MDVAAEHEVVRPASIAARDADADAVVGGRPR